MATMAEAIDGVRKWAATVAAGLAGALVIGGLNLHSDVQVMANDLAANIVLTQATTAKEAALETQQAGVKAEIEGLRRDIDKVGDKVDDQARESAERGALILQELGKLQGKQDHTR